MKEGRDRLVNIIRPSVFSNQLLLKLGSYSPRESGTQEFCSWGLHFKGIPSMSFKKAFLGCKNLYLDEAEKGFKIASFLK